MHSAGYVLFDFDKPAIWVLLGAGGGQSDEENGALGEVETQGGVGDAEVCEEGKSAG